MNELKPYASWITDWNAVDWSKENWKLAAELGCSRECVRMHRKKAGAPKVGKQGFPKGRSRK